MEIFLSPPGWESVDNSSMQIRYEGPGDKQKKYIFPT